MYSVPGLGVSFLDPGYAIDLKEYGIYLFFVKNRCSMDILKISFCMEYNIHNRYNILSGRVLFQFGKYYAENVFCGIRVFTFRNKSCDAV